MMDEGSACLPLSMSAGSMPPLVQQAVSPTDNSRNGSQSTGQPGGAAACTRAAC